jgi:hypothetical protein
VVGVALMKRTVTNPSFLFALVLLLANGAMWAYTLAPEGPAVQVEPRLEPDLADLRDRLREGGHSGEPFTIEVTDQEAAETIAWYLSRHPKIPFSEPQVVITPQGIAARGVAEIAGLRVGLTGEAHIVLRDGVPIVALGDLDVAGVAVPGFVRNQIQQEIDAQFALALDLPVRLEELELEVGRATVEGMIR